jgi:DNA polymerase-2
LPIALEGFYKWIAFLPSKADQRIPVPNRYFGAFENGEIKVRGIEMRRHDTPLFIAAIQQTILEQLAKAPNLNDCLPVLIDYVRSRLAALRAGQVKPQMLLVSQTLSRSLAEYSTLPPAARAAAQLQAAQKLRFPGQQIRFVFTIGHPGVFAWDLPQTIDTAMIDVKRYITLTLRAVAAVLQPWGIKEAWLAKWILHDWYQTWFYLAPVNQALAGAQTGNSSGQEQPEDCVTFSFAARTQE